jgi:hypothetical protein
MKAKLILSTVLYRFGLRMPRKKGLNLTEFEKYILRWIADDKEFLEKTKFPKILVKNMEFYESTTQEKLNLSGRGRKNFLIALAKLKSEGLVREDNVGNILLTQKGWLIANDAIRGVFDLDRKERRMFGQFLS